MDLIYTNSKREDVGVLLDYAFDLAFGADENDFELAVDSSNHKCQKDCLIYIEGTEYGGIVDDIGVETAEDKVIYNGRTWHGVLNSKVLEPDAGEDYLVVSGDANAVLGNLISRMGLASLFTSSGTNSGVTISGYQMNRYVKGYDGIRKMLKDAGAKLKMSFKDGLVELSAVPIVDYAENDQFDRDLLEFKIKKKGNPLNHAICLGKGDLAEREVIHVYADAGGNILDTQILTGLAEVVGIYENTNASDSAELRQGGIDMIKEAWASDELEIDFNSNDESYDIGDIVGALEYVTGIEVKTEITKKIVQISNGNVTVSYPCERGSIVIAPGDAVDGVRLYTSDNMAVYTLDGFAVYLIE